MAVKVRPATASDAPTIDTLFREFVAFLRTVGDTTDYQFGATKFLEDGFGPDPAFRALVAEDGERVIGYLIFSRAYDGEYKKYFYMADLFVSSPYRSFGVGRQLMDALAEVGRRESVLRIAWSVHKTNTRAIKFYESLDAKIGTETHTMYLDL